MRIQMGLIEKAVLFFVAFIYFFIFCLTVREKNKSRTNKGL